MEKRFHTKIACYSHELIRMIDPNYDHEIPLENDLHGY